MHGARVLAMALLAVLLLATPVHADGRSLLDKATKGREASDEKAVVEALAGFADAFNTSTDFDLREAILWELGLILLDHELGHARVMAAAVLGNLNDKENAWYELEAFMPTADEAGAGPFEQAVVRAAGKVGPDGEVVDQLIVLAREAADDSLAAAAIQALGGYDKGRKDHARVVALLLGLIATLAPSGEGDDAGTARWQACGPALVESLRALTGRKKASAHDFAEQGRRAATAATEARPAADTPPDEQAPTKPTTQSSWEELFAGLEHDEPARRLAAVDEVFDRTLVGDDIHKALVRVIEAKEEDWRVLSMALRSLAVQDTQAEPPRAVLRNKKHKRWQVRIALAEGLLAYRHRGAVEALIDLLGDKRMRVRDGAAETLYKLTGQDHGVVQKRWAEWLRERKGVIRFIPPKDRPADYSSAERDEGYAFGYNRFFGARIRSDRVVLVLDKSESMYYGLFDQVIEEVALFLSAALPTTFFGVIEFDEQPRLWQRKLAPANDRNAEDVLGFLKRAKPTGPTNVMDSLREAMAMRDVDSVVLLSDGMPNRGTPSQPEAILAALREINRYARVGVHTLQMELGRKFPHDGPHGKDKPPLDDEEKARRAAIRTHAASTALGGLMKAIADQNEGTFGVVFGDWYAPPPDATFHGGTDK